jgi:hypothetical protein
MLVETTIEALLCAVGATRSPLLYHTDQVLHLRRKFPFYIFFYRHFAPDGAWLDA